MAKLSYYQQRLAEIGLTTETALQQLPDANKKGGTHQARLFSEDAHGNVEIIYYQLNGAPYTYRVEGSRHAKTLKRVRLKNPTDAKYLSPKGQGLHPYFPPQIIHKYANRTPIDTLFLIEGEFKSFAANNHEIDAVGLGGIHGFYGSRSDTTELHFLHPDLVKLLQGCKVKTVVLLLDADTLRVKWKYNKDLYKRQHSFRTAITNFYKVMHYYVDMDEYALQKIYFSHLKSKFADDAKGIDDLLNKRKTEKKRIKDDLFALTAKNDDRSYFQSIELDENYWTTVERYFGLENEHVFYKLYGADIGKKQFVYRNAKYIADEKKKVHFIYHKDTEKYFRIGTDWMKVIEVPNKFGGTDEKIVPFSIAEINRDYPKNKFPGFESKIKKFDAYCNEPDWSTNYSREHSGCYNLANPIEHRVKKGVCSEIFKFLLHIFGGEDQLKVVKRADATEEDLKSFLVDDEHAENYGEYKKVYEIDDEHVVIEQGKLGDQFVVGLDWLTIFHRYPKQMLPVIILVSKEFGTGKSTFFKWLKSVYGSNVAILNNDQFKMRFNSHYITKSLIAIDESFLDVDKKAEKERLKQMVTADTAYVEHKGVNLQEFPFYGKVMMGSNDAETVMRMDDDENRWFVVKVKKIDNKAKDPDLEAKMRNEIPHWLHFIERRQIVHPREQRLWFSEEHFITEQFREIVKNTKTRVEMNVDDLLKEYFITYKLSELKASRNWLVDRLNERAKYKTDQQEVKRYLDKKLGYQLQMGRIKYPDDFNVDGNIMWTDPKPERHYVFSIDDWLTKDDFDSEEELTAFLEEVKSDLGEKTEGEAKLVSVGGNSANEDADDLPF